MKKNDIVSLIRGKEIQFGQWERDRLEYDGLGQRVLLFSYCKPNAPPCKITASYEGNSVQIMKYWFEVLSATSGALTLKYLGRNFHR